jgi:2,3-bisphosphoglycerate-dependent phosphoglycerate mutase
MFNVLVFDVRKLFAFSILCTILFYGGMTGCNMTESDGLPVVKSVTANGQLILADGSSRPIPHYGEPGYWVLFAVRHCEKAKDGTDNPDLTPEGRARAERLGRVFDDARIDRIWSTSLKRTIQTAEAVKRFAGDPVMGTFPPAAQNDWLNETLAASGGQNHVYVGHQNTVPQLLNFLTGSLTFQNIPDQEFGLFYVVVSGGVGKTEVLRMRY